MDDINNNIKKITILGAGAFGFAIAKLISDNGYELFLFDVEESIIEHINKTRRHLIFHKNAMLSEKVKAVRQLKTAVEGSDLVILAIPSSFLRGAIRQFRRYLAKGAVLLNLAKGLENKTNKRISEILEEELKGFDYTYSCLSGGMIAQEIIANKYLCAELACKKLGTAKKLADILKSDYLKICTTKDIIGVELAGAFKNVIAIGAGIFDGLESSGNIKQNLKPIFISESSKEMAKLAVTLGAEQRTFKDNSKAWCGDIKVTCFGASRNREFGKLIGKGFSVKAALKIMADENKSVEGFITVKVVYELLNKNNLKAPLLNGIYDVLYKSLKPIELFNSIYVCKKSPYFHDENWLQ
ncbi:MAG: NAD(P)H-dependent glycerol-3-phosphate dehydrogenase [Candidatus Woesearchaeota archaeon]